MDKIIINDLEVYAFHGVNPEENKLGQKFLVSAVLHTNTRKAGISDNLEHTIHYGIISREIVNFMKQNTYNLLECAAEKLAMFLLKNTPLLESIEIEIKKPWAPIGLPVNYVSVKIERSWHTSYVGIGSNMGDKQGYIESAIRQLKDSDYITVTKVSDIIMTNPYGEEDQDDFLNGCIEIRTLLPPSELLDKLHEIESGLGRERIKKWGPRTLDLDILLYDDLIMNTPELVIPHYDMHNRIFVLEPLASIAPHKIHPIFLKTIKELSSFCPAKEA